MFISKTDKNMINNLKNVSTNTVPTVKEHLDAISMIHTKSKHVGYNIQDVSKKTETESLIHTKQVTNDLETNMQDVYKSPSNKHKILILNDDCGRYCSRLLTKYRELDSYEVTSIIKPGALLSQVIENMDNLCRDFTLNDYIIVVAGSNDVNKNRTPSFRFICNKLKLCTHTNILFTSIPYKKQSMYNSLINKHIYKYNSKLNEFLTKFNNYAEGNFSYLEINPHESQKFTIESMVLKIKSFMCCAKYLPKKNLKFIHTREGEKQSVGVTKGTLIDLSKSTSTVENESASVNVEVLVQNESCDLTSGLSLDQEFVSSILLHNNKEQHNVQESGRHFLYPRLSQTTLE